jgi:Ca-activated chloride channel family protein
MDSGATKSYSLLPWRMAKEVRVSGGPRFRGPMLNQVEQRTRIFCRCGWTMSLFCRQGYRNAEGMPQIGVICGRRLILKNGRELGCTVSLLKGRPDACSKGVWAGGEGGIGIVMRYRNGRGDGNGRVGRARLALGLAVVLLCGMAGTDRAWAQDNPLNQVETPAAPPPKKTPEELKPVIEGGENAAAQATTRRDARIRVDVNLVLVPMTVTDPMNRLVTGLERENFQIFDNNVGQVIKSFSTQDSPLTIGIIFDLSGSMGSKFLRARKALSEFLRTCNPQDEFFVVGFNDRPAVIVDYTSDVDDVEARMVMLKPQNRTALIDAIYLGTNKLRQSKYDRKALLIISDGGDNRSRYTEGELRRVVRESDVQIYSIGIFDQYAPTQEEILGPTLLTDICEMTGGRLFRVNDVTELGDIAARISAELRNEYVIGYRPSEVKRDGNWRKLKVRLVPPSGLPPLTVHNRQGYYAPSQ